MPFVTDIPIDCADVETRPLAHHLEEVRACQRLFQVSVDEDRKVLQSDLLEAAARRGRTSLVGEEALTWLREHRLLKPSGIYGRAYIWDHGIPNVIAEISPSARVLSQRFSVSDRGEEVIWEPPWAEDFNAWATTHRAGTSRLIYRFRVSSNYGAQLTRYARERGFGAVAWGENHVTIVDPGSLAALYPASHAPLSFVAKVKKALVEQDAQLSEVALLSITPDEAQLSLGNRMGFFTRKRALAKVAEAERYLSFVVHASENLLVAPDRRTRTSAALDVVLGLRRYLGLVAEGQYALGLPDSLGWSTSLLSRLMAVPGPGAVGRVRPQGMKDWPDALVELALARDSAPAKTTEPLASGVDELVHIHKIMATSAEEEWPRVMTASRFAIRNWAYRTGLQILRSPEIGWWPGAITLERAAKQHAGFGL